MYGFGPGPYLFGGPKGLEAALDAFEKSEYDNWLAKYKSGEVQLPE